MRVHHYANSGDTASIAVPSAIKKSVHLRCLVVLHHDDRIRSPGGVDASAGQLTKAPHEQRIA